MTRIAVVTVALLIGAGSAKADTLPLIPTTPPEYSIGTPVTFELRAPGLIDFRGYYVQLIFDTDLDNPDLTITATMGGSQYPFPTSPNFQTGTGAGFTQNALNIFITDTLPVGDSAVATTSGVNDLLATISVTAGPSFSGPIRVSVDPSTLRFLRNEEVTKSIDPPDSFTIEQAEGGPGPAAVPVPAAWVLMTVGVLGCGMLRRRLCRE